MIPRDALINKLRTLKFHFKRRTDRIELYRQSGSTCRVEVPRRDLLDETYVRIVLNHAGATMHEIDLFIAEARRPQ